MSSILNDIKTMLGGEVSDDNNDFDVDITIAINAAFMTLGNSSIKSLEGYSISSKVNSWDELNVDSIGLETIKAYVYLRVKLLFDPPQNSYFMESMKEQIAEYEWRLKDIYDMEE